MYILPQLKKNQIFSGTANSADWPVCVRACVCVDVTFCFMYKCLGYMTVGGGKAGLPDRHTLLY